MRVAIVLSLFGCIWELSVSQQYFYGEKRYCANYHDSIPNNGQSGVPFTGLSGQDCQDECNKHPRCTGYIMSCGIECYLMANCSHTVVSSCNSYVAAKNQTGSFMTDPWQSPRFLHAWLLLSVACVVSACIFSSYLQLEDEGPVIPRKDDVSLSYTSPDAVGRDLELSSDITTTSNTSWLGSDRPLLTRELSLAHDGDRYTVIAEESWCQWHILFTVFLVCVVAGLPFLLIGMNNFPKDGNYTRGVCGMVHGNFSEYSWHDLFSLNRDRNLLINGSLYLDPAFDALPRSCQQVYSTDVVHNNTGPNCQEWCEGIAGKWSFHFFCSFPTYGLGHIYMVCNKVFVWEKLQALPWWTGLAIAFIYGCASRLYAEHVHGLAKLSDPEEYAAIMRAPKPDPNNCIMGRQTFKPPFCLIPASSDASILRAQTWGAVMSFVVDPVGDLNGSISFLLSGELVYASCLLLVTFIPNLHDPLQTEGTAACLVSLERGFLTRKVYMIQMREGSFEGIYSLMMAVFIMMRESYFHTFGSAWHFWSIMFVAITSVMSSLPHAGAASLLLQSNLDFDNYIEVEETSRTQTKMKFIVVFDGFALAVAFGRTFSNLKLAVYLWLIGASIGVFGVLGSMARAALSERRCMSCQILLAFLTWPFSPVRLAADQRYWQNMVEGRANVFFIGSRGCASLPPTAFYAHRWLTLIAFWLFTVCRPDNDVYVDTLGIFLNFNCPEKLYKLLLAFIFILGWLCLPLSMLWYWLWGSGIKEAYAMTKSGQPSSKNISNGVSEMAITKSIKNVVSANTVMIDPDTQRLPDGQQVKGDSDIFEKGIGFRSLRQDSDDEDEEEEEEAEEEDEGQDEASDEDEKASNENKCCT